VMARKIKFDKPGLFSGRKGIFQLIKDDNIVLVRGAEELETDNLATSDGYLNI
jgi:hypothetical protein